MGDLITGIQSLNISQLITLVLVVIVLWVLRPVILTQRREVDARNEDNKQRNAQTASWIELLKSLTSLNNQQTEALRTISVQSQSIRDAVDGTSKDINTLAARSADLILQTKASLDSLRIETLTALDKLPATLKSEIAPLAQSLNELSAMATANKAAGDAIVQQIQGVERNLLDAIGRLVNTPVLSPIPVNITNWRFERPIPTLAESARRLPNSPTGNEVKP